MDIEQIKKNYENFDDSKIEILAKNEAGSLEPDVIPILVNEIKKRNLDIDLIKGIEAQTKELTEKKIQEIKLKIESLTCPECGQKESKLIGTLIRTVKSFIVFTSYKKTLIISCRTCADKKRKDAMITTAFLGWWGIPWGLFRTPQAIIASLTDNKKREQISDEILTVFAIENIGEIITNWDKENELTDFIHHRNRQD
jgi:Lhr-like helicase